MTDSSKGNSNAPAESTPAGEARGQVRAAVQEVKAAAGDKVDELAERGIAGGRRHSRGHRAVGGDVGDVPAGPVAGCCGLRPIHGPSH